MIVPIGDKILVKPVIESETEVVKSGILVQADKSDKKIFVYEIISLGAGVPTDVGQYPLKTGDKLYAYKYALQAISDKALSESYIIKYSDVVALYKE